MQGASSDKRILFWLQSGNVKVCDIDDSVKEALKKFRFRQSEISAALIRKLTADRNKKKIPQTTECVAEL